MAVKHKVLIDGEGNTEILELTARKAIQHHCKECMGFEAADVKRCTAPLCALFPFRTWETPKKVVESIT